MHHRCAVVHNLPGVRMWDSIRGALVRVAPPDVGGGRSEARDVDGTESEWRNDEIGFHRSDPRFWTTQSIDRDVPQSSKRAAAGAESTAAVLIFMEDFVRTLAKWRL